jgi:hypothetical protein
MKKSLQEMKEEEQGNLAFAFEDAGVEETASRKQWSADSFVEVQDWPVMLLPELLFD